MPAVIAQLALDVPNVQADPLSDLDFDDHEERLDRLDQARSCVDPLDALDFSPPVPAPTCGCAPHGLHVTRRGRHGLLLACGRSVTGDRTSGQGALSGDGLQGNPSREAR